MTTTTTDAPISYATKVNPCTCCAPLGAALVFKGIQGGISLLHGSQGCATYIRRFLISHFREPIDIASSSFTEESVIFGGGKNMKQALDAIIAQYHPEIIGIATTCLAETIGDDISLHLHEYRNQHAHDSMLPCLVPIATPAYRDNHSAGYSAAVRATLCTLATTPCTSEHCGLIPGIISAADIRYIKELATHLGVLLTIFPDYSDTLDGGTWDYYQSIPSGGTPVASIKALTGAPRIFDWSMTFDSHNLPDSSLFTMPIISTLPPIGIQATDDFIAALAPELQKLPDIIANERSRLLDAYVDGHKYLSGVRVAICADEPLALALVRFCSEIGLIVVLCATSRANARFASTVASFVGTNATPTIIEDADYDHVHIAAQSTKAQLLIGTSKFNKTARELNVPLVRVGFPVHDRFGASRILHVGYRGAQSLFDTIVNSLITHQQQSNEIGWGYL